MQVQIGDNILLVGTAHVSKSSVEEVREAIETFRPDTVAVELDEVRHKAITNRKEWEATPFTKLLKGTTLYFFLAQTFLASYQRRMGEAEGVEPGAEMLEALRAGEASGAEVALADRDIGVTFKRAFAVMGFREKMRILWELMRALVGAEKEEEREPVDKLLDQDVITTMMEELGEFAPSIKSVVIDERDLYLATRIMDATEGNTKKVVGVVGAGHLQGIKKQLEDPSPVSLELLEHIPRKSIRWGKIIGYGIPLLVLALFGWLAWDAYQTGSYERLVNAALYWVVINGALSALGALIARGHILSIITAFIAAPITSLNPALAAGWFAGLTEAFVRKPTVADFNGLAHLVTMKDMFNNQVMRVIMVAALANVGSAIGTYLALGEILRSVF
ncbi:MAG: TraB/GumN family protein [Euryarchaeota archaeon]|nr:TraB/GumN family protein [Euryarchaeota archaeon]